MLEEKPRGKCPECDGKGYVEYEMLVEHPSPQLHLVKPPQEKGTCEDLKSLSTYLEPGKNE